MRKFVFLLICLFQTTYLLHAQVGINTTSPKATLDITKGAEANVANGLLIPRVTLLELNNSTSKYGADQNGVLVFVDQLDASTVTKTQKVTVTGFYFYNATAAEWQPIMGGSAADTNIYNTDGVLNANRTVDLNSKNLVFSNTGNLGIGTTSPTNKLHISGADPLRLQDVTSGNEDLDKVLVIDANGVVKNAGTIADIINNFATPSPALFELTTSITDFLSTADLGYKQNVPMAEIKNEIDGLSLGSNGTQITFPAGTYQISFVYEATHDTNGTISSYFVDFPIDNGTTRVHSTAAHDTYQFSNHGGTVTFVTTLTRATTWTIALGRGQSGDCTGPGMTLIDNSTQLLIYRLGN